MAQDREDYKEKLREAGRRRLEEFRRQRGSAVKPVTTGAGVDVPVSVPSVELTTFRVLTLPADATSGPVPAPEPTELRMLAPVLASTSLGALPPGSSCNPPPSTILSSSPCSVASAAGSVGVSSLGSTVTGFVAPGDAPGTCGGLQVLPGGGLSPRHHHDRLAASLAEEDDLRLHRAGSGPSRGGGGDQALVDMLLAQVEALMREKAALAAENGSLRQQVEQLTELVGWLSLERGGSDGDLAGYPGGVGDCTADYPECSSNGTSPGRGVGEPGAGGLTPAGAAVSDLAGGRDCLPPREDDGGGPGSEGAYEAGGSGRWEVPPGSWAAGGQCSRGVGVQVSSSVAAGLDAGGVADVWVQGGGMGSGEDSGGLAREPSALLRASALRKQEPSCSSHSTVEVSKVKGSRGSQMGEGNLQAEGSVPIDLGKPEAVSLEGGPLGSLGPLLAG